jgi:hypothetical protein
VIKKCSLRAPELLFERAVPDQTMLFCDTPAQSAVAAVLGGLGGGIAGLALGIDALSVVVLAGLLGGCLDLGAHLLRQDEQFRTAVSQVRS